MSLTILLLGSGAREHALAWRLAQSDLVAHIYLSPGNAGTHSEKKCSNIPSSDFSTLVNFALQHNVNLLVPGPEQPLVDGIESHFRKVGIPVFGPNALAARMEGSKAFSKDFMLRHNIPTATFKSFHSHQFQSASEYVKSCGHRVVLKASGLAAGKGVLIPESNEDALVGLEQIMLDKAFGSAGDEVVIEEYLTGPEISVLAFSDGYSIVPLPPAQDHKRINEGDTGPNTGGMGAYAPAPVATPEIMSRILRETLHPTIDGMRHEGYPFVGTLFTGFILTESGPKVLEYNVRFGDPETEAILLLLDDKADLAAILDACANRHLDSVDIKFKPGSAVSVVLASAGYPYDYQKNKEIIITHDSPDFKIFHAGTKLVSDKIYTNGGRVIAVSAYAPTLEKALEQAYKGVDAVHFDGKTYRRDIAHRALQTSSKTSPLTYAQSGVSVDAGNALVEAIKPYIRSTRRSGADTAEIGGFGGVFDLKATGYQDPVLVSGTDGVGTKLRVAVEVGKHDSVGIDLVAMSVNDLLVQGAEPLFFLDYYGCSKLDVEVAAQVVKGIAEGCRRSGCALIGGETAEMPGMYQQGDYDLAGFAVGAVERSLILPSPQNPVCEGDILLGLASSGVHSNGFSLIRKIISHSQHTYSSPCPWLPSSPIPKQTIGEALLTPTRIYTPQILSVIPYKLVKALAHITGGGFVENIPRVIPPGLGCKIDLAKWELPGVFKWLMKEEKEEAEVGSGSANTGVRVSVEEMVRTFNCGIGMVVVVGKGDVQKVVEMLRNGQQKGSSDDERAEVYVIGEVVSGPGVRLENAAAWG